MDASLLRVLSAEVRGRRCPGCGSSLRSAEVSARYSARDTVTLHFRCGLCVFEGGGEIEVTPDMYREAAHSAVLDAAGDPGSEPISADEILLLHEALRDWSGGLQGLITR